MCVRVCVCECVYVCVCVGCACIHLGMDMYGNGEDLFLPQTAASSRKPGKRWMVLHCKTSMTLCPGLTCRW